MTTEKVYGFRVGSCDYPIRIAGPFNTLQEARDAAYGERCMGSATGRVRCVSPFELMDVQAAKASGVLKAGW